jgi:cephalosporin hydroxylase
MSGEAEAQPRESNGPGVDRAEVERVSREFTRVFHDLRKQTFSTTSWLGVGLVKTPNDIVVMQQIIAETRPELIVETGVYLGGSALLFASLMDLLGIDGKVVAIDIDLDAVRPKVREHPSIELIEGSSVDPVIVSRIRAEAEGKRTMVDLDSDHRAHHVLEELRIYSRLVTPGCYLIVEDSFLGGRPVRPEAVPGPSEALDAWFGEDPPFVPDRWHERYLLTQNPRGYLRRVGEGAPEPRPPRPDSFVTGALELSGVNGADFPTPEPEHALEELTAAAGEPDLEVEELRRSINNMARHERQSQIETDLDRRREELTVEGLLREIDIQRELLRERDRLLQRDRARIERLERSLPYRAYRALHKVPGLNRVFAWRDRKRILTAQARNRQRSANRERQSERFFEHHRGQ